MTELIPVPLDLQLTRAFLEYEREGKIFDLPKTKFFSGLPGLDTSVRFHGQPAGTPVGPAAGPHAQLLQNIVLSWLGGARIIELKTVQVLDELHIPRPCIDAQNVGYNVEWSQELKLEQSLREYVGAAMFLEILKASHLLGEEFVAPTATIFDMSVGYNLEGIRSPRVRRWIESMKDARAVVDELRIRLTGRWAAYRDFPFPTRVSDTLTLSTFHGCPAEEIEGIVNFLLTELDVHVCVKLNPTLLGQEEVAHLLHDVLGYRDIQLHEEAFRQDLQFDDALDLLPRLDGVARSRGKRLAVKFSNTLVVKNHRRVFADELMYLSGPPLHVLTLNLVKKFRERIGQPLPVSFSAGMDAHNVANVVAMNFVPATTCTDLLRPGGYGRLHRYLENLGAAMHAVGATAVPDFVLRFAGQEQAAIHSATEALMAGLDAPTIGDAVHHWLSTEVPARLQQYLGSRDLPLAAVCENLVRDFDARFCAALPLEFEAILRHRLYTLQSRLVETAGRLNTPVLVDQATGDPRYAWAHNHGVPRKIGSKLWLYDCITCDKCVPVCPNDANFVYDSPGIEIAYDDYELLPDGTARTMAGRVFRLAKLRQFANYADACNDCGNCDVFCPEDGGPFVQKPRFFGSRESYRKYAGQNGFFVAQEGESKVIYGTIAGHAYTLRVDLAADRARLEDAEVAVELQPSTHTVLRWSPQAGTAAAARRLELLPYLQLRFLADAITDPRHVHYANVATLKEESA